MSGHSTKIWFIEIKFELCLLIRQTDMNKGKY
jgi:hypothetical protein